jgi:hypothetical protein
MRRWPHMSRHKLNVLRLGHFYKYIGWRDLTFDLMRLRPGALINRSEAVTRLSETKI